MGTPAMTTRGFSQSDFARVAEIVDHAVNIAIRLDKKARQEAEGQGKKNAGTIKVFNEYVKEGEEVPEILSLRQEVENWVGTFAEPWIKDDPDGETRSRS